MKRLGQGGFATLEVILMVTVIGILAAIAVPRFEDITAKANTARIQSDLTTIDTAIALYDMNESVTLTGISALKNYIQDADSLMPPTNGKVYVLEGSGTSVTSTKKDLSSSVEYAIGTGDNAGRAVVKIGGTEYTAGKIAYKSSST